jgi:hypothetical protein
MSKQTLKTPEQARAWFDEQGLSIAEWARQHGFSAVLVRTVLKAAKPCVRGQSHQIAVLLGMKHGVITRSADEARQGRADRAAKAGATGAAAR